MEPFAFNTGCNPPSLRGFDEVESVIILLLQLGPEGILAARLSHFTDIFPHAPLKPLMFMYVVSHTQVDTGFIGANRVSSLHLQRL